MVPTDEKGNNNNQTAEEVQNEERMSIGKETTKEKENTRGGYLQLDEYTTNTRGNPCPG